MLSRRRALAADLLGLTLLLAALLDYLQPALLFLPTITAGGDTPCHYPTAVWFKERLLPELRFHGWYPGAYVGQPLLLYYFPIPFLAMAALAPLFGMPVAFKLGASLGIFLLPPLVYVAFRAMRFAFPAPLLAAGAAYVFLFLEANPIWGGTIASTMTGEFSYTYGLAFAVLFLGVLYRDYAAGAPPYRSGALLALTALAHGYGVLWAGLTASYFLYASRRPWQTLQWLLAVAAIAFALAGFQLLPLLQSWGFTTPYDDPWIDVKTENLFPLFLAPLVAMAGLGLIVMLARRRPAGGLDHRLLFLLHAALVAVALAAAGPALGIIDVRFVPFAQLALTLLGGACLGLVLAELRAADLAALACLLAGIVYVDRSSTVCRHWAAYNFTGLEAKELWPAFQSLTSTLRGSIADPRVAVEYSTEHEKAGSIRMYESLPYFTGRSTLEGVYNQASLQTHFVYYLASELGASSPNPFRNREYSSFDTDNALRHLRLYNTSEIVALSEKLKDALAARADVGSVASFPPYAVYRLKDAGPGYVEPLAFEPVRSPRQGWRDKAYRWFSRKPLSPVHLVFTDDARFRVAEQDEWLPPPAVPLPGGVEASVELTPEEIRIRTNRVGHPLLVKVSWHPRWKAEGADGPYLVSPALMLVVPRQPESRLVYRSNWSDILGRTGSLGAALLVGWGMLRRRAPATAGPPVSPPPASCGEAARPPRRWGALVPISLLLMLFAGRSVAFVRNHEAALVEELYGRASRAYAEERYGDAEIYAREALARGPGAELHAELLCLRAESLLKVSRAGDAAAAFEEVLEESPQGPYAAQALFGLLTARSALGETTEAEETRIRLVRQFPGTPWAERASGGTPPKSP